MRCNIAQEAKIDEMMRSCAYVRCLRVNYVKVVCVTYDIEAC